MSIVHGTRCTFIFERFKIQVSVTCGVSSLAVSEALRLGARRREAEDLVTSGRWHFLTLGTSRERCSAGGNQTDLKCSELSARVPCTTHSLNMSVHARRDRSEACGLAVMWAYCLHAVEISPERRACAFECVRVGCACVVRQIHNPTT